MKKILALVLALAMLVSLAGCTQSGTTAEATQQEATTAAAAQQEATTAKAAEAEKTAEVETLSVLMYTDWYNDGWKALESYINENAEKLGFKIEIETIVGGEEGDQILDARFATGDLTDVVLTYGINPFTWVSNGKLDQLVALDSVDMSDYDMDQLKTGDYFDANGTLYGVPFGGCTMHAGFYSQTAFEKAGITAMPTTWDEFLDCCKKLKDAGITPMYISGADSWTLQIFPSLFFNKDVTESGLTFSEFMHEINTNKRHYADLTYFKKAHEALKELIDLGYVNETYLSDTYDMAQTALAEGTCGMYVQGDWVYSEIQSKYPEKVDTVRGMSIPMFGDNNIVTYMPYAVSLTKNCKNQEAGLKFMNFFASAEAQQIYATAVPAVYLNKNVTCDLPQAYLDLMDIVHDGRSVSYWMQAKDYDMGDYAAYVQDYLVGTMTIDEVMEQMDVNTAIAAKEAGAAEWQ